MAICKLCKSDASLRNSHIIPELCFKPLYDEKHRAQAFQLNATPKGYVQKGFRERLFCDDCEQRFSVLENYFARAWFGDGGLAPKIAEAELEFVRGFDYSKFKLFHHSILFRASVSKRKEFSLVELGKNEDVLRNMILSSDPGDPDEFPFYTYLLYFPRDGSVPQDFILQPIRSHTNGKFVYTFVFGGCCWLYFGSRRGNNEMTFTHSLSRKGTLTLVAQSVFDNAAIAEFINSRSKRNSKS